NIKNGEEEVQKAQLLDSTAVALTEAKKRVDENPDHRDYMDRWNAEQRQIRDQANQTIQSFETPRQAQHATIQLGHLLTQANIHAQHTQQALSIDYQRAEGMQSLEGLSRLAARDPDLSGRERWARMAVDIVHTLGDTNVLKPTATVECIDQFKKHRTVERLKYFSTDLQQEL